MTEFWKTGVFANFQFDCPEILLKISADRWVDFFPKILVRDKKEQ